MRLAAEEATTSNRKRLAENHRLNEGKYSDIANSGERVKKLTRSWYSNVGCFLINDFVVQALGDGAAFCFIDNAVEMPTYVDRGYLVEILKVDIPVWYTATKEKDGWIKITFKRKKKGEKYEY